MILVKMSKKKLWEWVKLACLFLTLIVGSVCLYQWWSKKTKLTELESRLEHLEKHLKNSTEQYQLQQQQLSNISSLAHKPALQKFFTNLLQTYSQKFADNQNIDLSAYPLNFGGFYPIGNQIKNITQLEIQTKELGNASFNPKTKQIIISLNQLFLFNKLGHEQYFATPELHLEIDFNSLMKVISHELAHYFQFVEHGKSSCKSELDTNQYDLKLAQEHEQFTQQIYQLIKNSEEYPVWESEWNEVQC